VGEATTVAFQDHVDQARLVQGLVAIGVLIAGIFCVPWGRLPRWTDAIVPLAFLLAVALLRDAAGGGASAVGSLVLLPVVWFALFGTGREVAAAVIGTVAVFIVPALTVGPPNYPGTEMARGFNLLLVASMIGYVVRRLVRARAGLTADIARVADTDSLTGLPNRGAWIRMLDDAVTAASRSQEPLWVAILDIDDLKAINDQGGHAAGDLAITSSADAWSSQAAASTTIARLGGDEFGVLLAGRTEAEALDELDALRQAALPYACSVGLAQYAAPESPRDLLGRSDKALYVAKNDGRNTVSVAPSLIAA
jgi:diguanylate cyclase (GGDEF)-like protein